MAATRRAQIIGTGLVGGSIGLALRRAGWQVTGSDIDPSRAERARHLLVAFVHESERLPRRVHEKGKADEEHREP